MIRPARSSFHVSESIHGWLDAAGTPASLSSRLQRGSCLLAELARAFCSRQTCGLSLAPPKFDAGKLSVSYLVEEASSSRRRYTLTHNDITGELFLSVGSDYNTDQVSGWCARPEVRMNV